MKNLFTLIFCFSFIHFIGAQGSESFENHTASGSSYGNGSYTGDNGSTWSYGNARNPSSTYQISGKSIGFGSSGSRFVSSTSGANGVDAITFSMRSYFTGGDEMDRSIEVLVDGMSQGTFTLTAMGSVETNTITGINKTGNVTITFASVGSRQIVLDDVSWEAVVMPVELTSFTAKETKGLVTLDWQTASEVNNEGFHIERSVNGVDFDAIAFVDGHGDSQETIDYSFVDDNAKPGLNYYRLKQVDYDGAFEYSDVISITTDILKATVSPSKTADLLTIFTPAETLSQIGLYDMSGNLMHSLELKNGSKTIDISDYPVGMYFVKILSEGQVQTEKIFKI